MNLRIIGAGLPRTGTSSLRQALGQLLDGECYHMGAIPDHPWDLGSPWDLALDGQADRVDWDRAFDGYVAAVDWPTSQFWPVLAAAFPDALILLSERDSPDVWYESMDETVLKVARRILDPEWSRGRDLVRLLELFAGTTDWDDTDLLRGRYNENSAKARQVSADRLLTWVPTDGWEPICRALDVPVPDEPFPWLNLRSEWG